MSSKNQPQVVVIGDGWAALGVVGFLLKTGERVFWLAGTGSRMAPALPSLELEGAAAEGAATWRRLADAFDLAPGEVMSGSYLREFRNKAFREPMWMKAQSTEGRVEGIQKSLWGPEQRLVPVSEGRFMQTLLEIEAQLRERVLGDEFKKMLKRVDGVPLSAIRLNDEGQVRAVALASGEEIACSRVYFADRWNSLAGVEGVPKALPFTRKREPAGVLQAMFTHESPIGAALLEGFFGATNKDPGEDIERNAWGYFSSDGLKSVWTLCLSPDEVEDNHTIAKKLRRMKGGLDKMFTGSTWLPEGKGEFMATVRGEQVRFEEAILFTEGEPVSASIEHKSLGGVTFLTDGYGPSFALAQVGQLFPQRTDTQAENVDVASPQPEQPL